MVVADNLRPVTYFLGPLPAPHFGTYTTAGWYSDRCTRIRKKTAFYRVSDIALQGQHLTVNSCKKKEARQVKTLTKPFFPK